MCVCWCACCARTLESSPPSALSQLPLQRAPLRVGQRGQQRPQLRRRHGHDVCGSFAFVCKDANQSRGLPGLRRAGEPTGATRTRVLHSYTTSSNQCGWYGGACCPERCFGDPCGSGGSASTLTGLTPEQATAAGERGASAQAWRKRTSSCLPTSALSTPPCMRARVCACGRVCVCACVRVLQRVACLALPVCSVPPIPIERLPFRRERGNSNCTCTCQHYCKIIFLSQPQLLLSRRHLPAPPASLPKNGPKKIPVRATISQ
jgi:hypothetical protein